MKMAQIVFLIVFTTISLVFGDTYGPPGGGSQVAGSDNAHYKFEYGVNDPNTQDVKSQQEQRDGHQVMGTYMLREPDGTTRVVRYKSGPNTGFEAVVEKTGQAQHPASYGGSGRSQGVSPQYGVPGNTAGTGGTGGTSYVGVTHFSNQGQESQGGHGYSY